jgi:hypothetical protein
MGEEDCYHVAQPCNCGKTHDEYRYIPEDER